jgi:cytochrome c biogenesis protein CcmG/thiol:disulfide interchange protein DsbE
VTAVAAAAGVIGDRAPDAHIQLPVLGSHRTAALADYRGRTVVVTFYATWCMPCRSEARVLNRVGEEMRGARTGQAILIDERDPAATARAFATKAGLSMAILSDPNGAIADAYGIPGIPATFILDRTGRIAAKLLGTADQTTLRRDIANAEKSNS